MKTKIKNLRVKVPTLSQRTREGWGTRLSRRLGFGFGFEFDVAVGEFDGVFNVLAVVLMADLFRLFLDERGEGFKVTRDFLAGFLLGCDQSVVKALDLLALGLVDAVQRKGLEMKLAPAAAAAAWLTP